ncbi:MAG: hypothetical protein EOP20_01790 [Hyphomicrobiales bacterium]|nr:MAG: hypothetical protein EOP20_01790 [Hyphomicrobiales bacterium]
MNENTKITVSKVALKGDYLEFDLQIDAVESSMSATVRTKPIVVPGERTWPNYQRDIEHALVRLLSQPLDAIQDAAHLPL